MLVKFQGRKSLIDSYGTGAVTMETSVRISHKSEHRTTICPAVPLLGIFPKDCIFCNRDSCSSMFTAALLTMARKWNQPRCPLTDEFLMKTWYITQWNVIQL